MATGFTALRDACPMQLAHVITDFTPSEAVLADLARLDTIWAAARAMAQPGPWLLGGYSLADVFFAPVAARIIGYDLPVTPFQKQYALAHIADPAFQAWRRAALEVRYDPFPYHPDKSTAPWPEGVNPS
jgi:glutathione S-transferase